MALSDVRTRVVNNVNRDDIADVNGGLVDQWINDSQRKICRAYNFAFMETEVTTSTVDEQQNYQLPAGSGSDLRWKAEISCELINSDDYRVRLSRIFKQDAERRDTNQLSTDSGTPSHYSIQKGQIYFYPIPDHAFNSDTAWTVNLEYYGFLDDLSADTDTNDLITNYPEVVEAFATALAYEYALEEERASFWLNKGNGLVQDMVAEDISNQYGNIEEGMEPEISAATFPRSRFVNWNYT